jgi:hypothetical protein
MIDLNKNLKYLPKIFSGNYNSSKGQSFAFLY